MSPTGQTQREKLNGTGVALPARPVIYEINTWLWLRELSRQHNRRVTLADVPETAWDTLADLRFDVVWLMGVWERSPEGITVTLNDPTRRQRFDEALPGWTAEDVIGSPYSCLLYTSVLRRCLAAPSGPPTGRTAGEPRPRHRHAGDRWPELSPPAPRH